MTLSLMFSPKKALIIQPSFSGYERALSAAGTKIEYIQLTKASDYTNVQEDISQTILKTHPELVIIANPNNPNGWTIDTDNGLSIINACNEVGAHLIVDECFIELTDNGMDCSFAKLLNASRGMVILRAFTKSFAVPGIRLGYGLCSDSMLASYIKSFLPEWNVSSVAQKMGIAALSINMDGYFTESRRMISTERQYLTDELAELGMKVYPSRCNYILFEDTFSGGNLKERLIRRHILIRDCSDYTGLDDGYYRIAVRDHQANEAFIKAMKEELS